MVTSRGAMAATTWLVVLEELFFGGQLALAQIEKLGAVEADAVGPVLQGQGDFFRQLDIGQHPDGVAVAG